MDDSRDPDPLYIGLFRQAVWGSLTFEAAIIVGTVATIIFVLTQNVPLSLTVWGGLYLGGVVLSLKDPFYLSILILRYSPIKLDPTTTQRFWGGRRYMP